MKKLLLLLVFLPAAAMGRGVYDHELNLTIEHEYPELPPVEVTELTVTSGLSEKDIAEGISGAIAAGSHQFDYTTTRWQLSLTGAWLLDESEDNFSVGLGKRFGEDSFLPNSLFHGSYTPIGDGDWVHLGVTIVF